VEALKFWGRGNFLWGKKEFFMKVSLDHFTPNLYILNNNPVFEPSYAVCINRDLCPGDNGYSIGIKSFSSMNAKNVQLSYTN